MAMASYVSKSCSPFDRNLMIPLLIESILNGDDSKIANLKLIYKKINSILYYL